MKIAIVGPGLIGTSIALAARRARPDVELIHIDRDEPLDVTAGADVVVLAAPVDVILNLLRDNANAPGDAVIIDTGSTKRAIVSAARSSSLQQFVGGHPMAGGTSSGPSGARANLFDGKPWILVPAFANDPSLGIATSFVEMLGATPIVMSDDGAEHDRIMAAISHVPQVVASALMTVVGEAAGEKGLSLAGGGLRDTTRLAGSAASMWESILASNAAEVRPLLIALADNLRTIADRLDDREAVRELFEAANHYRAPLD